MGSHQTYNSKFSKGLLKKFVQWIFHHISSSSTSRALDISFCVCVREWLGEVAAMGEKKVYPYMPLCAAVINSLKRSRGEGGPSSLPSTSPAPHSPSPCAPSKSDSGDVAWQLPQGRSRLPDPPEDPLYPSHAGTAHPQLEFYLQPIHLSHFSCFPQARVY